MDNGGKTGEAKVPLCEMGLNYWKAAKKLHIWSVMYIHLEKWLYLCIFRNISLN